MAWYNILGIFIGAIFLFAYGWVIASIYRDCKRENKPFRPAKRIRFALLSTIFLLLPIILPWSFFLLGHTMSIVFDYGCRGAKMVLPPNDTTPNQGVEK